MAIPHKKTDTGKFPTIIANHGFHPDPPRYGITAEGVTHRPGDYYRQIPEVFTREGFLVVMPDYRGHNSSEGSEFTHGFIATNYYTQDVLALLNDIDVIDQVDPGNIFMWGHSMGGEVSLRSLLATSRVKAASLWATAGATIWEQAYFYSRHQERLITPDSHEHLKKSVNNLKDDLSVFRLDFDWDSTEPFFHLQYLHTPLIIHHSIGDTGTHYEWSARLASSLARYDKQYQFYSYDSKEHLFKGRNLENAVARDVAFFRSFITSNSAGPDK